MIANMRSFPTPAGAHVAVGIAAFAALVFASSLQDYEGVFLWAFGVPWVAGFIALLVWPRANATLPWLLPAVPVLIGLAVWVIVEAAAGIG